MSFFKEHGTIWKLTVLQLHINLSAGTCSKYAVAVKELISKHQMNQEPYLPNLQHLQIISSTRSLTLTSPRSKWFTPPELRCFLYYIKSSVVDSSWRAHLQLQLPFPIYIITLVFRKEESLCRGKFLRQSGKEQLNNLQIVGKLGYKRSSGGGNKSLIQVVHNGKENKM